MFAFCVDLAMLPFGHTDCSCMNTRTPSRPCGSSVHQRPNLNFPWVAFAIAVARRPATSNFFEYNALQRCQSQCARIEFVVSCCRLGLFSRPATIQQPPAFEPRFFRARACNDARCSSPRCGDVGAFHPVWGPKTVRRLRIRALL